MNRIDEFLDLLRCPLTGSSLRREGEHLVSEDGARRYEIDREGIPLFAQEHCSPEARLQAEHYDRVSAAYLHGMGQPYAREYAAYIDNLVRQHAATADLGTVAELCCGRGELVSLLQRPIERWVGVDVSLEMLRQGAAGNTSPAQMFAQGDATELPLTTEAFDAVFMLGGVHHVNDRTRLFREVCRILKPGGLFVWREPCDDFLPWRLIRKVIYRLSPALDESTEAPLRYGETTRNLREAGLCPTEWRTCGFLGFCLFMNSDVLVFNRLFGLVPGIRWITRLSVRVDELALAVPGMQGAGTQVVGVASKPA